MNVSRTALDSLTASRLAGMRRGVEKESLRVDGQGALAQTPHPAALGAALTHPHITTDYSEAQLELVTGAHATPEAVSAQLLELHQYTARALAPAEMMWASSMPCCLPREDHIPIGRYGDSNVGRAKTVYRLGLAHRYGRRMQTISGIHYNWSLPGLDSAAYFGLIRNFRRHAFLLLYLFGASPALCSTFVAGRTHQLQRLAPRTLYLPHATSLRMGRLGYQSEAQASLAVSYNGLDGYAASLHEALSRPYPDYEAIGLRGPDGEYRQLATSLLQIENEFYGTIRPKRNIGAGERPLHALRERGVEYVEVRLMDLDPFEPLGITPQVMRFLDVFLLHCLLADSPPDTPAEIARLGRNQHRAAEAGREPGLRLERGDGDITLAAWGHELLDALMPVADALDASQGGREHAAQVEAARALVDAPDRLPSARVLQAMAQDHGHEFPAFALARSRATQAWLLDQPWDLAAQERLAAQAEASLAEQRRIEAADSLPFEAWRQQYTDPRRLGLGQGAVAPSLSAP